MRLRLLALALCAGLGAGVLPAAAATAAECTGLPKHGRLPVVDAADVVPPEDEAYLAADLLRHHVTGHEAIVAATVPDLGGDDVSSYARRLFDCWGIGDAKSDNGILVLVAMRERRVRVEAGAGLDGRLSEAQLEAAIDAMVAPLRAGDVAGGLRAAAASLVEDLGGELPDTRAGTGGSPRPTAAPGDVQDTTGDGDAGDGALPVNALPGGPFGLPDGDGDGGSGLAALVPILFVVGVVASVVRAVMRGGGLGGGGASSWRGGFPAHGSGLGWQHASLLRGGAWSASASPWDSGSGGSSFGGSSGGSLGGDSGGDSGGSSFGGGSSGGGGASGSW